jgi:gliding motility-associated-like protein
MYADTGTVQQLLTNQSGCDSLVIDHAVYGGSDTTFLSSTTCAAQDSGWQFTLLHNHFGCDSILATYTTLLPSDATFLTDTSCLVGDTGVLVIHLTNRFGCDSIVTLTVILNDYNACHLEYSFTIDTPACEGDEVFLHIDLLAGEGPVVLTILHLDQVEEILLDSLGHYDIPWLGFPSAYLIFNSANGIERYDSLSISYPHQLIIDVSSSQDFNGYSVPCYGDDQGQAEVIIYQNGTPPLSIAWSNGETNQTQFNLPAGVYTATITDSHGCEKSDSIVITEPPPLSFELTSEDLSCFGIHDGMIQVNNMSGGIPPLLTSLQGEPFNNNLSYANLASGLYTVIVLDKNGCELTDTVTIHEPKEWSLSLGPDTTLTYGSSLNLDPKLSGIPQGILQTSWSDGECENCLARTITPLSTITLTISAQDENGCTSVDELNILVQLNRDLFIPNIFSPNGDQVNDVFLIGAGPTLDEISILTIFDRWGNMVFQTEHFKANDPQFSWDGKKNGQLLNPGVFVFQLEAVFIDGSTEERSGSVTLIR